MIYSEDDIINLFLTQVSESGINFVTDEEILEYIKIAFQRCYPQYHLRMQLNLNIPQAVDAEYEVEVPINVQKIAEIEMLKDDVNRYRNIRMTDWDLLPYINGANNRILIFHRALPACDMRILAQGVLDYFEEKRIDVPSIEPIILYMQVLYFSKLKAEAVRNRDKDSYVIYQNSKNDAYNDFKESLNTNRMAQMFMQRKPDHNRKRIDLQNFVNYAQVIWSSNERSS